MMERLQTLRPKVQKEFQHILDYWMQYAVDNEHGGFFGRIDNNNRVDPDAAKGAVLNARILWTFSAAHRYTKHADHLNIAGRAFHYVKQYFIDPVYGGVYWTVNKDGSPADTKKQLYACAFVLYGLSEYYRASNNDEAKALAISLYETMLRFGYDRNNGGFFEAFSREWHELSDQRLSNKDANEKKSMNTNLHVLEAFSNLYLIWPDDTLKDHIIELLQIFHEHIIDHQSGHLHMFFDELWNVKPDVVSYGHDIEASWLLYECAEVINHQQLIEEFKIDSGLLCDAAMEGLDSDGGLWYEKHPERQAPHYDSGGLIKEKHWWPQAEALVGFFHNWQLSGHQKYLDACIASWQFIESKCLSPKGEWYWGITADGSAMNEDKVGVWKCPYHNTRACLEILKRLPR